MSEINIKQASRGYCILCGVCGKAIPLNEFEARHTTFRLCDECIKAIKFARRLMITNPRVDKILPCLEGV